MIRSEKIKTYLFFVDVFWTGDWILSFWIEWQIVTLPHVTALRVEIFGIQLSCLSLWSKRTQMSLHIAFTHVIHRICVFNWRVSWAISLILTSSWQDDSVLIRHDYVSLEVILTENWLDINLVQVTVHAHEPIQIPVGGVIVRAVIRLWQVILHR